MRKCTSEPKTILTVTQIDNQKVLDPENLARNDNILVIYGNINGGYSVKPLSVALVKTVVEFMADNQVAFLLLEQKDPPAKESFDSGTTDNPNKEENSNGSNGN